VILVLQKDTPHVTKTLASVKGVIGVETFASRDGFPAFRVLGEESTDLSPQLFDIAHQNHWQVRELRRDVQTLERVFNNLAVAA